MLESNPKLDLKNALIILVTTLIILVIKAFILLPIPQRALDGHGLYQLVNALQIRETAVFTFLIVLWLCISRLKLQKFWSILIALACMLCNLGLMIIDFRYQQNFYDFEKTIVKNFGTSEVIFAKAIGISLVSGILMLLTWWNNGFTKQAIMNKIYPKWVNRLFYSSLIFLGLAFIVCLPVDTLF